MDKVMTVALLLAVAAFVSGWKVATWQRDSVDLVIRKTASATSRQLAGEAGRKLENSLEELKNAAPREIRSEIVKPVFTNVCVSADFVRMYNDAAAGTERVLSGKP